MSDRAGAVNCVREGTIATVTLANPARLNAMTRAMWLQLRQVFEALNVDVALRCVVLRGEQGNFCAGGDISEYPGFRFDEPKLRAFHEDEVWGALQAILDCPVPVVAQIEGACMGAGLEMASACDVRLAGRACRFGAPIAKLGFPMAPREAALVHSAIGDVLARDMLLSAGVHDAKRLYASGFLLQVFDDAEVPAAVWAYAQRVAALAPQAARLNKKTLNALARPGALSSSARVLDALCAQAYIYAGADEHREGIEAFLAKRPPIF